MQRNSIMNFHVIAVILVIGFAWYIQDPIPDNFSEPWRLRMEMAINNMIVEFLKIADTCGIYPFEQSFRKMINLGYDESAVTSKKLIVTRDVIEGIDVLVYKPKGAADSKGYPGLVYYHGGGWYLGNVSMYNSFMIDIAERLDIIVISVDYRLAPEHMFPVPLEDCLKVTKHVLTNGDLLNIDRDRVAVAGDSAGGNLAAAVALKLRDEQFKPMPKLQLLLYPLLQGIDFSLPSYIQNGQGPLVKALGVAESISIYAVGSRKYASAIVKQQHTTSQVKKEVFDKYIRHDDIPDDYKYGAYQKPKLDFGDEAIWNKLSSQLMNPYFAPLMASDLSGLPDAYVYTSQHDVLRDDGILYGKRLADAGVDVRHFNGPSSIHAACSIRYYKEGHECLLEFVKYLSDKL